MAALWTNGKGYSWVWTWTVTGQTWDQMFNEWCFLYRKIWFWSFLGYFLLALAGTKILLFLRNFMWIVNILSHHAQAMWCSGTRPPIFPPVTLRCPGTSRYPKRTSPGLFICPCYTWKWSWLPLQRWENIKKMMLILLWVHVDTLLFSPIKLGPLVTTPPFTEGEFYSVVKRSVVVQVIT